MKMSDERVVGILGTVIIHLVAAIIIMSFQIRSLKTEYKENFSVEFIPEALSSVEEKLIEVPVTSIEKIFQGDEEMLNIAKNLANKADPKINRDDYIDMVKEELIKSGKLSSDNYIDEKKSEVTKADENIVIIDKSKIRDNADKPTESQEMAANYKGPTRIYYDLAGRTHTYLPLPIYKCQGSGNVTLNIEVNQNGTVERAQIISGQSTTSDPCLIEAAVTAANISRFNSDIKAPKIQTGTLSYHFVAQ
jgi:hypothetical protein